MIEKFAPRVLHNEANFAIRTLARELDAKCFLASANANHATLRQMKPQQWT